MSDTPRTDDAVRATTTSGEQYVHIDFARNLERELAAARAELSLADLTCKELAEKVNSQSAQLERAIKVVGADMNLANADDEKEIRWTAHDLAVALGEWEAGR